MLTRTNKRTITTQGLAFAADHPDVSTKHIVEAFEAAWFQSRTLTDDQLAQASHLLETTINRDRADRGFWTEFERARS